MSSIPSIVSGKSAVTDITTASERSTNTTSTTSGASTIQFNPKRTTVDEMDVESEAGQTNVTSLSEIDSSVKTTSQSESNTNTTADDKMES